LLYSPPSNALSTVFTQDFPHPDKENPPGCGNCHTPSAPLPSLSADKVPYYDYSILTLCYTQLNTYDTMNANVSIYCYHSLADTLGDWILHKKLVFLTNKYDYFYNLLLNRSIILRMLLICVLLYLL